MTKSIKEDCGELERFTVSRGTCEGITGESVVPDLNGVDGACLGRYGVYSRGGVCPVEQLRKGEVFYRLPRTRFPSLLVAGKVAKSGRLKVRPVGDVGWLSCELPNGVQVQRVCVQLEYWATAKLNAQEVIK